jgi:hypothetical protein
MPFPNTYQSLLHRAVAAIASLFNVSIPSAYHATIAITYSLGAVTLYLLARSLGGSRVTAVCSGLIFSLFSPSGLLIPAVRHDVGGLWNARRLQALVVYGEGPNCTGLMLTMLALALLHRALKRRTALAGFAAAVVLAAVPATNWPSTVALTIGLLCYGVALDGDSIKRHYKQFLAIGGMAIGLALPLALPSTIRTAFGDANVMMDAPTPGVSRWIGIALLLGSVVLLRTVMTKLRTPLGLRFAVFYSSALAGPVILAGWFNVRILPNAMRFHIALEIGLALMAGFLGHALITRWPKLQFSLAVLLAIFCCLQFVNYRRYAHGIIRGLDITKTVEYQEAQWFDQNMQGERVEATGTVSFWMNAFTDTPQMIGTFDQSVSNPENRIAAYLVPAGYRSDSESAEYSLLWMKAYAVHAVAVGGLQSREYYKGFQFPNRFDGTLPAVWRDGDDRIYLVPERSRGIARVVHSADLVIRPPENGIDVTELRPFVAAFDDPGLPQVETFWEGANRASIKGRLGPDQVLALAMNYDPGWTATANTQPVPVRQDGLGFMTIDPRCSGSCVVQIQWSAGWEPRIALALAFLAIASAFVWWWLERTRSDPGR